jgi:membrane protease YdiL (CAAX protease family)
MAEQDASKEVGIARRIVAYPLTLLIIGSVMVIGAAVLGSVAAHWTPFKPNSPQNTLMAFAVAVLVVLTYKGYKRWVERAPDLELALAGAPAELAAGLVFGALLFGLVTGIVALLGGFEVLGLRGMGQFWSMLAMAIVSGTFEEVLFRGIILRHLEALTGTWIALGLTAAFFGGAHLLNPNASWFAALAIALEAGILLGAAYLLTRRLWLAIGIHAAWNFTQGWVLSVPVSGGDAPIGLLVTRRIGADWLTGGEFGLEASVVAMVVATLAGLYLVRKVIERNGLIAPVWQREKRNDAGPALTLAE